jgi:lysophospholipase L1-like esterase
MRRVLILLASVSLTVGLAAPVAATRPTPTVYIALGDSLAWGDGASVPTHTGYVPRLAGYFQGASHGGADELINLGVGGTTTGQLLSGQVLQALAIIGNPATDTRVVTISVGGNDLLNLINDPNDPCLADAGSTACQLLLFAAMTGVATNMPQILWALQGALAADPGIEKIFVLLPYNAFNGTGHPLEALIGQAMRGNDMAIDCAANANPANVGLVGLDDILACTAASFGAVVVDSYPLFEGRTLQLTHMGEGFNVHPNDAGYEVIAKAHRVADRAN